MATRLVGRHSFAARGHDLYETPLVAVEALMAAERLPQHIWEPACGRMAIARPLRAAGHFVLATDLVAWAPTDAIIGVDFLQQQMTFDGGIVTNPPYKLAQRFAAKACELCPFVALLLPLTFLEGQERQSWLKDSPLARVHVFSKRLPMMHRDGWDGPIATSTRCFAWFVWDRARAGEAVIRWL